MARGKFIDCLGRLFCFHLPSASMARQKFINCLARLFCFRSPPIPHGNLTDETLRWSPCGIHTATGTATGSCTCGLDTLRDGSFDFHEIEETIQAILSKELSEADLFRKETEVSTQEEEQSIGAGRFFSHDEIDEAIHSFDPVRKLGEGGYSTVYLGKLKDGQVMAIKVLHDSNRDELKKYIVEICLFCSLRHQNLLCLYGCTSGIQELVLVYEYMRNGSVAEHLHGHRKTGRIVLTWDLRIRIAMETAEAITYLHFHPMQSIIHCDIKTDNILFDDSFHVKVGDFGLSDIYTSSCRGTLGYLDPEYDNDGILTDKSDVYSFGVVLLELISGQMAVDVTRNDIYLVSLALNMITNKELELLVDPNLEYQSDSEIRRMVNQVAELACLCLQSERNKRPSMAEVVWNLKRIRDNEDPDIEHVDFSLPARTPTAHISNHVSLIRRNLQETGLIVFLELLRSSYGHKLSTILLFTSFVQPEGHAAVPENDSSPWGTACGCRLYLQNNRILEGLRNSPCFFGATLEYIGNLASIGDLPLPVAQRIVNYMLALNPTE